MRIRAARRSHVRRNVLVGVGAMVGVTLLALSPSLRRYIRIKRM